ncbi:MAG: hypothetical protein Q4C80_03425 [Bacillota bacterium]|nr:hypothetical protein [Bacillota bacterium]
MKTLWNKLDKLNISVVHKSKLFIFLCTVIGAVIGSLCWELIRVFALDGIDWMLVFICYPGFFLFIISVSYLYRHEFDN